MPVGPKDHLTGDAHYAERAPERERPNRTEQEVFRALETLCISPGYIHALTYFAIRDNFYPVADELKPEDLSRQFGQEHLVRTEYNTIVGLFLKGNRDFKAVSQDVISRYTRETETLLEELHDCLNGPMHDRLLRLVSGREGESNESTAALREPIFYTAESAYYFQYSDLAVTKYREDSDWLREHKGFDIEEAARVVEAIRLLQQERLAETVLVQPTDDSAARLFDALCFEHREIASRAGLSDALTMAVLVAFSVEQGSKNAAFDALSAFNEIAATPLIPLDDERYLLLNNASLFEALYDGPYYWMMADKGQRAIAAKHRGQFTENFATARLGSVFGEARVFKGVDLYEGKDRLGEIDVLVTFGDRAIVVQAKSKRLTLESRRGNDQMMRADFKASVQDAYEQAVLCCVAIRDGRVTRATCGETEIEIPIISEFYPVCIVSDHYPALNVQARELLQLRTEGSVNAPLISDVFTLDVIATFLASPLRFLSYIDRRVKYHERVNAFNELVILGYHLRSNLWIEKKDTFIYLDESFSAPVDVAMMARRGVIPGAETPDGILTRFAGTRFESLLAQIEYAPAPVLIELGMILLSLGEHAVDNLSGALDRILNQALTDGREHDVTMPLEGAVSLTRTRLHTMQFA